MNPVGAWRVSARGFRLQMPSAALPFSGTIYHCLFDNKTVEEIQKDKVFYAVNDSNHILTLKIMRI